MTELEAAQTDDLPGEAPDAAAEPPAEAEPEPAPEPDVEALPEPGLEPERAPT